MSKGAFKYKWWWMLQDIYTVVRYRFFYCPRYGHRFDAEIDYCLYCGKKPRGRGHA